MAALGRRGHQVELFTTGEMAGARKLARESRFPSSWPATCLASSCEFVLGLRQGLIGLPKATPPEIVYQRHSMNNLAGVLLARRWRVPLVLEANASEVQWREEW